jgi:hypothetical protein
VPGLTLVFLHYSLSPFPSLLPVSGCVTYVSWCLRYLCFLVLVFPSLLSVCFSFSTLCLVLKGCVTYVSWSLRDFCPPGAGFSTYIPFPFFLWFSLSGFPSLLSAWFSFSTLCLVFFCCVIYVSWCWFIHLHPISFFSFVFSAWFSFTTLCLVIKGFEPLSLS